MRKRTKDLLKVDLMTLRMSELTLEDIDMARSWVSWNDGDYSQPVSKVFLSKLLDEAERGIKIRDKNRKSA